MNMQRKVTGHRDQPKCRNRDTQPNARRNPWVRTESHDVIARIKSIELLNKVVRRVYTNGRQLLGPLSMHPALTWHQRSPVKYVLKKSVYEGNTGKQDRPGTRAHPRGVTKTGAWPGRDIDSCSCRWCYSHRIALVSHDTYEIRNSARARFARA